MGGGGGRGKEMEGGMGGERGRVGEGNGKGNGRGKGEGRKGEEFIPQCSLAVDATVYELKKVLQLIWDQLPQDSINKPLLSFLKRLRDYMKAGGGHFEHTLK